MCEGGWMRQRLASSSSNDKSSWIQDVQQKQSAKAGWLYSIESCKSQKDMGQRALIITLLQLRRCMVSYLQSRNKHALKYVLVIVSPFNEHEVVFSFNGVHIFWLFFTHFWMCNMLQRRACATAVPLGGEMRSFHSHFLTSILHSHVLQNWTMRTPSTCFDVMNAIIKSQHYICEHDDDDDDNSNNTPPAWKFLRSLLRFLLSSQPSFWRRRLPAPQRSYEATSSKTVVLSIGPCRRNARENRTPFWNIPWGGRQIGPRLGAKNRVCFALQTAKAGCLRRARMDAVPALSVRVQKSWNVTTTMMINQIVMISKRMCVIKKRREGR